LYFSDEVKYALEEYIAEKSNDEKVPSQENASNGTYKVTRLLFMNTKGAPEGITKAFIDYIYTPEGTEIIKKSGYIPTGRQ